MQTHRGWRSFWRSYAVTRVAAAAPSGLRSVDLRPFAVWGLLGPALAVGLCAASTGVAQEEPVKAKERIVKQEVTGQVVWVGKRAISVEYERTANESFEMLLPFDSQALKLEQLKNLAELKPGDTVRVQYNQTLKKVDDQDDIGTVANTIATVIALVRQAPVGVTTQSSDLVSGQ